MAAISAEHIHQFLAELAARYTRPATLLLLGGGALCLLGSERPTADIDYVGDDLRKNELQQIIDQLAEELQLIIDPVPISQFVPIPATQIDGGYRLAGSARLQSMSWTPM